MFEIRTSEVAMLMEVRPWLTGGLFNFDTKTAAIIMNNIMTVPIMYFFIGLSISRSCLCNAADCQYSYAFAYPIYFNSVLKVQFIRSLALSARLLPVIYRLR